MTAKTLLLLRHAKSSWDDASLADFDRPLAARGREAAPLMGREMARRGWLPDAALISPALRTRQTWELVATELPKPPPPSFEPAIYEAPAARILAAIRKTPESNATLLVVGHNPGLEDLAALIAASDSDRDALARLERKFPTAAIARFTLREPWAALGRTGAALHDFLTPRDLR